MPLTDLYDANFPHGSEVGFSRGCRGSDGCLYLADENYLTCREVHVARDKDPNISRMDRWAKVRYDQLNLPVRELGTPAPTPRPPITEAKVRSIVLVTDPLPGQALHLIPDPMPAVNEAPVTTSKDDHDATLSAPVVPAVGIDTPAPEKPKRLRTGIARDDPEFPHGTISGFNRGCKAESACPGEPASARTCRQAFRDYQAEWRRTRMATKAIEEAATPDTSPGDSEPTDEPDVDQATVPPAGDLTLGKMPVLLDESIPMGELRLVDTEAGKTVGLYVDDDLNVTQDPATLTENLRDELANAERAASELKTTHRRELAARDEQIAKLIADAESQRETQTATISSLATRAHELEKRLQEAQRSQELVPAQPGPVALAEGLQPTGGATHAAQLGLTINPTDQAGVSLGFILPGSGEQLAIRIGLSASDKPGLGDVAISVGSN